MLADYPFQLCDLSNIMASSITLGSYLFRRLRQLGVTSVHGVPGDTNLPLLDYIEASGMRWIK